MSSRFRPYVAAVLGLGLLASACSKGDAVANSVPNGLAFADPTTTLAPDPGATLRVGVVGVASFDPAAASAASPSSMFVADALFDGLTGYDASKGVVVGVLARSWSVASDGVTWTFELDPARTFSDGSAIAAADVKASLERVAALGDASMSGVRLAAIVGYSEFVKQATNEITGITATGSTVQIRLQQPFAALAELLASPEFGVVKATDVSVGKFSDTPLSSGPFMVKSRGGDVTSLVRTTGAKAKLGGIELHTYASEDAAFAAFGSGMVDQTFVPAERLGEAATNGAQVVSAPRSVSLLYAMNVMSPALSRVQIRQAILHAVNRDAIRSQYFPGAATMTGLIGPGVTGRRENGCGAACAFDAEAAKALVKEAYPNGAVPTVHVDYFSDDAGREAKVAEAIAANLAAAGIPAEARGHSFDEFKDVVTSGTAEIFRYGLTASYPSADAYLSPFEPKGVDNVFSLADDELGGLLNKARGEVSDVARSSDYLAAEDRVFALAPVLPLVQAQTHIVSGAKVRNVVIGPDGAIDVNAVDVER